MSKRNATISVRTNNDLKDKVVNEAKNLGLTVSDFTENCIQKVIYQEEIQRDQSEEIKALKKEISELKNQMIEKDREVETARKLKSDNEIIITSSKQLSDVIKIQEATIQGQQNTIQNLNAEKERYIKNLKQFAKENSGMRIGFFGYMEEKEFYKLIN